MRIKQTGNGFEILDDAGNWLLTVSGKDRYYRKLDETLREYDTYEGRFVRDKNHNIVMIMYSDGSFKQRVFDEWDNLIAEYSNARSFYATRVVYVTEYRKRRDGSVSATRINTKRFDDYWKWLEEIPTTFEVAEYVEPVSTYNSSWYDYPVQTVRQRPIYYPWVARERDDAFFVPPDPAGVPVEPVVNPDWVTLDEANALSNRQLDEAYRRLREYGAANAGPVRYFTTRSML